jgi:hypothetical protein
VGGSWVKRIVDPYGLHLADALRKPQERGMYAENAHEGLSANRVRRQNSGKDRPLGNALLLVISTVPIDDIGELPGVSEELELKLTFLVDVQLGGRIEKSGTFVFI